MGSRKEEERNEKIIRGLMKLPPNRRCINCNSLGPQYVCTNFWTFVCMTCSGIHREFTHRVKSVSMAKFTSQEVEALQNGGNQRAREIYLKDWDLRQRLPDSSNVEKVRQFIKNVYVDKKFAAENASKKPSSDSQSLGSREDDTRRASSYHSYSQSPPYDYQYEDRRYGKHAAALTRKPGSDRGYYVGRMSNFVASPGHLSEQMFEDRFANEGSDSRISDYSVSSSGDPFRSGTESPNFSSPRVQPSRDNMSSNTNFKRDLDGIPRPQKNTSSGSLSLASNFVSFKSNSSDALVDAGAQQEITTGTYHKKAASFTLPSNAASYGGLDLFEAQVVPEKPAASSSPPIDLFQLPEASSASLAPYTLPTANLSSAPAMDLFQTPQTSSASLNLFDIVEQPSTSTLVTKPEVLNTENQGWATFDTSLPAPSIPATQSINSASMPDASSSVKFDQFSSSETSMQWSAFSYSGALSHSPSCNLGYDSVQAPLVATNAQSWNAFDDSTNHYPLVGAEQGSEPQLAAYKPSSSMDQYSSSVVPEDSDTVGNGTGSNPVPLEGSELSHVNISPAPTVLPQMDKVPATVADQKSTNPFDFPYDSGFEQDNMFLDMSSFHAALPNEQSSPTFIGQSWFPQNPVSPYIPASQGGLAYIAGNAPSSQIQNVAAQGPVASIGGNPFA